MTGRRARFGPFFLSVFLSMVNYGDVQAVLNRIVVVLRLPDLSTQNISPTKQPPSMGGDNHWVEYGSEPEPSTVPVFRSHQPLRYISHEVFWSRRASRPKALCGCGLCSVFYFLLGLSAHRPEKTTWPCDPGANLHADLSTLSGCWIVPDRCGCFGS
jgi:hypothetical protein